MTDHPAKFSSSVLTTLKEFLEKGKLYLDPFAGTGLIHPLCDEVGAYSVGLEIEPEWAIMHPRTVVGDALHMPFAKHSVNGVATSSTYGNRMADHHDARDDSKRITYRHKLGRPLHPNNSGQLQWGERYRQFHILVLAHLLYVVEPGGPILWNVSNHIRQGEEMKVVEWFRATMIDLGYRYNGRVHIDTPRMGFGANHDLRVAGESLLCFQTPLRSRLTGDTMGTSRTTPAIGATLRGPSMTDTSVADATEATEPDSTDSTTPPADTEEAAEKKSRRGRGFLETDVKSVTDKFVTGTVTLKEGELLTPHRIARLIKDHDSLDTLPSTGAVSNVLDAWAAIGFASINDKPKAFLDYTELGREEGLKALKANASDAKKAARKAAKEAEKAAAAPAPAAESTES